MLYDYRFESSNFWTTSWLNSLLSISSLKLELSFREDSSFGWIIELFFSLIFWNFISFTCDYLLFSVNLEYCTDLSITATAFSSILSSSFLFLTELDFLLCNSETASDFLLFTSYTASDLLLFISSSPALEISFLMLLTLDDFLSLPSGFETLELCLLFISSSS